MRLKQYIKEDRGISEPKLMNALANWSISNKKLITFNKEFSKTFSWYRNIKEYKEAGGAVHGQTWGSILANHISDMGDDWWYNRKNVWKFWNIISKRLKITLDDLEQFEQKWNRSIYE